MSENIRRHPVTLYIRYQRAMCSDNLSGYSIVNVYPGPGLNTT